MFCCFQLRSVPHSKIFPPRLPLRSRRDAAAENSGRFVVVLREGKIEILKSYGLANVEHQIPVKPETVFQSGSIAKQFTAAAAMILAEDGKIALDDKMTKYFADAPEAWSKITVRHLLNHTSGVGDYPPEIDLRKDYTEDEYSTLSKKRRLVFETGAKWNYSNLGYVMLGLLVRKVTGKFYGDFLRERIFQPLKMTTARVISEADIIPNRAAGYRFERGELKNQEWVSPSTNTTADGALYLRFSICRNGMPRFIRTNRSNNRALPECGQQRN